MIANTPVMLIVGGSGSIGGELALHAAQLGWRVALHGRTAQRIEATHQSILQQVPAAIISTHCADFTEAQTVAELIADVGKLHGRIDAIVDCSVTGPRGVTGLFAETDPAAFGLLAEQSVVVFERLTHAALPWLRASRGSLLAIVSDAGIYAASRQSLIGAMRAATIGFVRNIAKELAPEKIRVNAISPSFVEGTALAQRLDAQSVARMDKARQQAGLGLPTKTDVAKLALFLCGSDASRITGQIISINGGLNT